MRSPSSAAATHRVSRALRQTLALKAKLARDEKVAASEAALRRVMLPPARERFATDDPVLAVDLDAHVRRACKLLDLPEELAAVWPSLPRPTFSPDPPTNDPPTDDTADDPPHPWSSSA